MSKVWLVTGSVSGLGRSIADALLASVIASSQRPVILAASKICWRSAADADRWLKISVSTDPNAPVALPALQF
jgi:NAD(P)-dependent dehydrogenase (short-subunit alcohol dehydrogenase family)